MVQPPLLKNGVTILKSKICNFHRLYLDEGAAMSLPSPYTKGPTAPNTFKSEWCYACNCTGTRLFKMNGHIGNHPAKSQCIKSAIEQIIQPRCHSNQTNGQNQRPHSNGSQLPSLCL
jgi:hypothetical protein